MKFVLILLTTVGLIGAAYFNAQSKMHHSLHLDKVKLGMTLPQVQDAFGAPSARERNQLVYIFEDSSEMILTLRDDVLTSAKIKFHQPVKITDPEMRKLTLVQMESESLISGEASWFFAGKPEEGLIYKVTAQGVIESLTWVPPFTYGQHRPKQLQALFKDFRSQRTNL